MGASDAVLPWALKILMISLVTVAVFIYRKPFGHLFSAVGYGVIGSRDRADASLARAGSTAGRNTVDAATVGVPGFAAYRVARWARRNPAQAASLAAQVTTGGATSVLAGAAAAGSDGSGGPGGQAASGGPARDGGPGPSDGSGARGGPASRGRVRVTGNGSGGGGSGGTGAGRTPPPLDLPPRQPDSGPPPLSGWARGGSDPARPRWPGTAPRPAPEGAPPRQAPSAPAAPPSTGHGSPAGRGQAAPPAAAPGSSGEAGQAGPFWLRPIRRRK